MTTPELPNYVFKIQRLLQEGKLKRTGLSEITISHDGWCRIHQGQPCNCNPDIYLGTGKDKKKIA